jgi:hypothetical protein
MVDIEKLKELLAKGAQEEIWRVSNKDPVRVVDGTGAYIALCDPHHKGNPLQETRAALIVAAVNSLPELLIELERLRRLVRALIENEPDDIVADGGHTVLDEWRYNARAALGETK